MNFLELSNIKINLGNKNVLKNISFGIKEGTFLAILGPSGCGKSTLLNSIAGLLPIDDGLITVDNQTVNDLHPSKRDIAMVFQSYALYPNMNVRKNISFGLECRGVGYRKRKKAINSVAEKLQITDILRRKPSQLSGGQRQRVAMARALVRDPKLFLFDEPLSNLDARLRLELRSEIKQLQQSLGTTTVYVTHDQAEAMTLASEIIVLKEGEIQQRGSPNEIYNEPANLFVASFLGSPKINTFKGRVETFNRGHIINIINGEEQIILKAPKSPIGLSDYLGKEVIVGIRPEAITESWASDTNSGNNSVIEINVDLVEPTGSDTFIEAKLSGNPLVARLDRKSLPEVNQPLRLSVNMDSALYFDKETTKLIK